MKYDFLKKGAVKSVRVKGFDGGLNNSSSPNNIADNQLSECKNLWLSGGSLKTRPGLSCEQRNALITPIAGYYGENKYKIHNAGIYLYGQYRRIVTAEVCTDDYAYYCNVFLLDDYGGYMPIGKLTFFRVTSEIFYTPINILFYTGKPQTGGGIFAMVTVQNDYDEDQRYYQFYEISEDLTEWNRIYNFYIPTLYINGRGNKYELARANNNMANISPKILESPNMLNGRFHSYFTSDGYSTSFRLPFADLASESVVCRIYYTLVDYVEWQIAGDNIMDTKSFFGREVAMEIDREKGTVYFSSSGSEYAIPAMDLYNENNIKITATKEIECGINQVIYSTCVLCHQSRIMVSGGESGNRVFTASYENPLYFPQNSSVTVGNGDSEVVSLSPQDGKIVALKQDSVHALSFKEGSRINKISLLADNDKIFYDNDSFSCSEINTQIGCTYKDCVAVLNNNTVFLGKDGQIYCLTALNGDSLVCISKSLGDQFNGFKYADFAFAGNDTYMIFRSNKALVGQMTDQKNIIWHYWEFPDTFKVSGGFWFDKSLHLLCAGQNTTLSYIATLNSQADSYLEYDDEGEVIKGEAEIAALLSTKSFTLKGNSFKSKIESIYLALASKGNINISVNEREIINLDLRQSDEEYIANQYKSVKIMPYIINGNTVGISLSSSQGLSVGDIEINYI